MKFEGMKIKFYALGKLSKLSKKKGAKAPFFHFSKKIYFTTNLEVEVSFSFDTITV